MSPKIKFPFHLAVINDEISPDFDHACHVVANEFNLQFIELRGLWGKNIINLTNDEAGVGPSSMKKPLVSYHHDCRDRSASSFLLQVGDLSRTKLCRAERRVKRCR
jgi:hypothetical protein